MISDFMISKFLRQLNRLPDEFLIALQFSDGCFGQQREGNRATAGGELGLLDQHVGDVVLDRESDPALGADQAIALVLERDFAHGTNQQSQELVAYHGGASLRHSALQCRQEPTVKSETIVGLVSGKGRSGGSRILQWARSENASKIATLTGDVPTIGLIANPLVEARIEVILGSRRIGKLLELIGSPRNPP